MSTPSNTPGTVNPAPNTPKKNPVKRFFQKVLIVFLLALVLAHPKILRQAEQLRFAIVIDSTVSMNAFTGELKDLAGQQLKELYKLAPEIEWLALSSDSAMPAVYRGKNFAEGSERPRRTFGRKATFHNRPQRVAIVQGDPDPFRPCRLQGHVRFR